MNRHNPHDLRPSQQTPDERVILSLQRSEGATPSELEQELAVLIRATIPSQGEPHEEEWQPVDEADRSTKGVVIEGRVYHGIDEIATENRNRVEERERALERDQPSSAVEEARKRVVAMVRTCYRNGVMALDAEVMEQSPVANPGRTDE